MDGGFQIAAPAAPATPHEGIAAQTASTTLLRSVPWAVCAITAVAASLRFAGISGVSGNEFYDAAVRSMGLSFHNFFFGAFDPRAILSIDKPPLDLWLQVISVKLFGWSSFALKLPEALAGTAAVPLLYDAVRRVAGRPAGLASASVLAIAPASVLTARSDTMDSVMMLLVVAALWLTVRAIAEPGSRRPVVLAGVALGLAFNVKVLEAVLALPALVTLYALAAQLPWRRKLADIALAGGAFVGVGLSWAILASIAPGSHPWPVGSSDGSVWNAMFVFNGVGRASSPAGTPTGGPGLLRLLEPSGWHFDLLFGSVLLAAVVLGLAAVLSTALRGHVEQQTRAFAISIAVWIAVCVLVFDSVGTMHTRYLEVLSPALAIAIGYGAVTLAGLSERRGRPAVLATVLALAALSVYAGGLKHDSTASGSAVLIIAVVGAARLARLDAGVSGPARWLTAGLIIASAMVFPVHEAFVLIDNESNDSLGLATVRPTTTALLSTFLRPRTAGIRYEVASDDPTSLAPLIIRDQRPILPLTSFGGQPLTDVSALRAAVASGQVRYGFVGDRPCGPATARKPWCDAAAVWIRQHGVDVSKDAGLQGHERLYRLD
jgi:4-amino-4-deoxy-L-arabinose transferase-like glycosyltransferase